MDMKYVMKTTTTSMHLVKHKMTVSRDNRLRRLQRSRCIVAATGSKGYIIPGARVCPLPGLGLGATTKHQHCQLSPAPSPMEKSPPTHSLHLDHVKILSTKISKLLVMCYAPSPPFFPSFHESIHIKALVYPTKEAT